MIPTYPATECARISALIPGRFSSVYILVNVFHCRSIGLANAIPVHSLYQKRQLIAFASIAHSDPSAAPDHYRNALSEASIFGEGVLSNYYFFSDSFDLTAVMFIILIPHSFNYTITRISPQEAPERFLCRSLQKYDIIHAIQRLCPDNPVSSHARLALLAKIKEYGDL